MVMICDDVMCKGSQLTTTVTTVTVALQLVYLVVWSGLFSCLFEVMF
jgi:hypothetical protein